MPYWNVDSTSLAWRAGTAFRRSRDAAGRVPRRAPAPAYDAEHFVLTMLWSADPQIARRADDAGVDRIGLDLEVIGKAERQRGLGTWVSQHTESQLDAMRQAVRRNELFCRINPIHRGSKGEIDRVVARGVDVLMLPMFTTIEEVERFVALVNGRAKAVILVEHRLAAEQIERIVRVPGLDNVHVGLTDLSLSLGVSNRFALLASDLLDRIATAVRGEGLRLCVAGIGRAMDTSYAVPADAVYAQYPRLGATGALISRAFFGNDPASVDVAAEVARCRRRMAWWQSRPAAELDLAKRAFARTVSACNSW